MPRRGCVSPSTLLIWIKAPRAPRHAGSRSIATIRTESAHMSATHPTVTLHTERKEFLAGHDQLKPFLLAFAIFAVSIAIAISVIGLPD
jgi:hypothetical protein